MKFVLLLLLLLLVVVVVVVVVVVFFLVLFKFPLPSPFSNPTKVSCFLLKRNTSRHFCVKRIWVAHKCQRTLKCRISSGVWTTLITLPSSYSASHRSSSSYLNGLPPPRRSTTQNPLERRLGRLKNRASRTRYTHPVSSLYWLSYSRCYINHINSIQMLMKIICSLHNGYRGSFTGVKRARFRTRGPTPPLPWHATRPWIGKLYLSAVTFMEIICRGRTNTLRVSFVNPSRQIQLERYGLLFVLVIKWLLSRCYPSE